jgi:hypothetical protein
MASRDSFIAIVERVSVEKLVISIDFEIICKAWESRKDVNILAKY